MWLLIEIDKQEDIGKNEKRRILLNEKPSIGHWNLLGLQIIAQGIEVHLMTTEQKIGDTNE